jgi:bile acid:Na+ symporter, BASS family
MRAAMARPFDRLFDRILDLLALIGRFGTQGLAASILVGLALPWLAAAARPVLPLCILSFIVLTIARADAARLRAALRRPGPLACAMLWLIAAPAATTAGIVWLIGRGNLDPGFVLGLALLGAAPPIMSGPAVASLIGIEPTLILGATLATTFLSPLTAPLVADAVAGAAVPLDQGALALRLAIFLGLGAALALIWRRVVGEARIRARGRAIDGAGVVLYGIFAIAAMDGVLAAAVATPGRVAACLALVFAVSGLAAAASLLVLRFLAPADRLVFGYGAGQRNMGMLVAALGAATPPSTYLFFALAQVPIYFVPSLVRLLAPAPRPDPLGGSAPVRPPA